MEDEKREPVWVKCAECLHRWIAMYTPMPISDAAKIMGKMMCPMCAADSKRIKGSSAPV